MSEEIIKGFAAYLIEIGEKTLEDINNMTYSDIIRTFNQIIYDDSSIVTFQR